jgi:hypothetical protein
VTREDLNVFIKEHTTSAARKIAARKAAPLLYPLVAHIDPSHISTKDLLHDPILRMWLEHATRVRFTSEYWYFLLALERYETLHCTDNDHDDVKQLAKKCDMAQSINDTFLSALAPQKINLSAATTKHVQNQLAQADPDLDNLFGDVRSESLLLMQTNNIDFLRGNSLFAEALELLVTVR